MASVTPFSPPPLLIAQQPVAFLPPPTVSPALSFPSPPVSRPPLPPPPTVTSPRPPPPPLSPSPPPAPFYPPNGPYPPNPPMPPTAPSPPPPSPPPLVRPSGIGALVAALITSCVSAGVLLTLNEIVRCRFDELRRRVYAPRVERRIVEGKPSVLEVPPPIPFIWLKTIFTTPLDSLLPEVGIDAIMHVGFVRIGFMLLAYTFWFDLSLLLAMNITGGNHLDTKRTSDLDVLTMGNIQAGSPRLWVHFISVVFKSGACIYLINQFSDFLYQLQLQSIETTRAVAPETYTILATDIPAGDSKVGEKFRTLWGSEFAAYTPILEPKVLSKLHAKREELKVKLENALWVLNHPPEDKKPEEVERPQHKTGFLGLVGEKVDSIDTYKKELEETEAKCAEISKAVLQGKGTEDAPLRGAAFVTFKRARAAALAAQAQHTKDPYVWRVVAAVQPNDVYWPNVGRLSYFKKVVAKAAVTAFTIVLCIFFMVPIVFIQGLTTLSNLTKIFPPLVPVLQSPVVRSIIEGVLPGLILIIFMALLPTLMRFLSAQEGIDRESLLDVAQMRKLFIFSAVNVFFGNIVAGSVISALQALIDNPTSAVSLIATSIPQTSRFFMTYVLLKAIGGAASAMSGMVTSIVYVLKKKFLGKTPRGEANCWAPNAYKMGVQSADVLLMFMIILIFTTLQPIMHVIGFLYFIPRFVIAKVQVYYLHEVQFEGYGAMWPVLRGRMIVALILYQITMIVTIALKLGAPQAIIIGVLVVPGTYIAKRVMDAKYNSVIAGVIPLEVFSTKEFKVNEAKTPEEVLPFLHPALRPEKPEELLQEGVIPAGITPAVEHDLVPPPPPEEEGKGPGQGEAGSGSAAEAAGPAGAAAQKDKDPEMVPPEDLAEPEEPKEGRASGSFKTAADEETTSNA